MGKGTGVTEAFAEGNFLGLSEQGNNVDVAILQLPYELTSSYGQGTGDGPAACIRASAQVELFDESLGEELPAGFEMFTATAWNGGGGSLAEQLDNITAYLQPWFTGDCFPMVLGGEHGILPPLIHAAKHHPLIDGDLGKLTLVQIDAHADLRVQLGGDTYSHACAAGRSLDLGVGKLMQVGVRAYSKQENDLIQSDDRITTFFARETQGPNGTAAWKQWIDTLASVTGPVHLTIDIDGLDGSLVPSTGTPVPGGLSYWQVVETIDALFRSTKATVISADVNEIVPQKDTPLTEFTAAMLVAKVIGSHLLARKQGRWEASEEQQGKIRSYEKGTFFQEQINAE